MNRYKPRRHWNFGRITNIHLRRLVLVLAYLPIMLIALLGCVVGLIEDMVETIREDWPDNFADIQQRVCSMWRD